MVNPIKRMFICIFFIPGLILMNSCSSGERRETDPSSPGEVSQAETQPSEKMTETATQDFSQASAPQLDEQLSEVAAVEEEENGMRIRLQDAFDLASDDLKPEAAQKIVRIGAALSQHPDRKITIEGHTDYVGKDRENKILSLRRAREVQDLLTETGVQPNQITVAGLGEMYPVASNSTSEGQAMNRRVEILVQETAA